MIMLVLGLVLVVIMSCKIILNNYAKDDCVPFDPESRSKIMDPEDITRNIGIRLIYSAAKDISYQNMLGLNVLTVKI